MIIVAMSDTTVDVGPGGSIRLPDWGIIRARGAEAAQFLHGQLTQDIANLSAGQARLAGYCSPKGRLLGTLLVWSPAPEELLLACGADVLPALLKRLSMFVLRAKCRLGDASAEFAIHGLCGPVARSWLGDGAPSAPWSCGSTGAGQVVRLPDVADTPRYLLLQPADAPAPALPALPAHAWAALEVLSGVPRVTTATVEQFVPQMVNLDLVGGVHFQKGCYPGQEIVARSQYRGTLKRRARLFASDTPLRPGQEIYHDADPQQPAGMVVLAAPLQPEPGAVRHVALVEVKLAALEGGHFHAGAIDAPVLQPLAMPYAVPLEPA